MEWKSFTICGQLKRSENMSSKPTVVVAMSGGVDSSVAAALLKRDGYDVLGVTMQIWQESATETKGAGCCSLGAVEDARRVAAKLDIPHYVLNFREFFADKVIGNFVEEYKRGRTPNPCVNCNRFVKFDALLAKAEALGADFLATGHYARVGFDEDKRRWTLRRARDLGKDQTYMLHHFTQRQLSKTLMPLGDVQDKTATRALAAELGLLVADKPDSQEICFVQGGSYVDFLAEKAPETLAPGPIVNSSGARLGEHGGIARYTVGQRRRIDVGSPIPLYVIGIDAPSNAVVVGPAEELLAPGLIADDVHWVGWSDVQESAPVLAKIRYNMGVVPATVARGPNLTEITVSFQTPQPAVTPGQAVVLYDEVGDGVLGGATIQRSVTAAKE